MNKFKLTLIVIYVILVAVICYFLLGYAGYLKNSKFLEDNEANSSINDYYFLSLLAATNYNDTVECFIEEEPIYHIEERNSANNIDLTIYAYTFFNKDLAVDGLFVIMKNTEVLNVIINTAPTLTLQLAGYVNPDDGTNKVTSTMNIAFTNTFFLIISSDFIKQNNVVPTIELISIYSSVTNFINIGNESLIVDDCFPDANKSLDLSYNNYSLINKYNFTSNTNLNSIDGIYYNPEIISNLKKYVYIEIVFLIVYFLVVLIIAYFAFVHFPLVRYLKKKKLEKIYDEVENNTISKPPLY